MSTIKRSLLFLSAAVSLGLFLSAGRHLVPMEMTEVLGFISGGYCVWLAVEENIWNWPVGIANSLFFLALFAQARLFADAGLQVVYVILGALGWYWWLHGGKEKTALPVRRITRTEAAALTGLAIIATAGATAFLTSTRDAAPFWDALTTVLSLVAQYLITKKVLENWAVWICADLIYIWLYAYKGLYLTSILYLVFITLCFQGFRSWRHSMGVPGAKAHVG